MACLLEAPFNGMEALQYAPDLRRCPSCGMALNRDACGMDMFAKPERSPILSKTIDGVTLASPAFARRYDEGGWTGLEFRALSSGYFAIAATRTVRILHKARHYATNVDAMEAGIWDDGAVTVRSSGSCGDCGLYRNQIGGGDVIIARGEVPVAPNEFVKSDVCLGSGDMIFPFLIAGQAIRDAHYAKRFGKASLYTRVAYQSWEVEEA